MADHKKPRELKDLIITGVAFVDKGANGSDFSIVKRLFGDVNMEEDDFLVLEAGDTEEEIAKAKKKKEEDEEEDRKKAEKAADPKGMLNAAMEALKDVKGGEKALGMLRLLSGILNKALDNKDKKVAKKIEKISQLVPILERMEEIMFAKAGRKISTHNFELIKTAFKALGELMAKIDAELTGDVKKSGDKKDDDVKKSADDKKDDDVKKSDDKKEDNDPEMVYSDEDAAEIIEATVLKALTGAK